MALVLTATGLFSLDADGSADDPGWSTWYDGLDPAWYDGLDPASGVGFPRDPEDDAVCEGCPPRTSLDFYEYYCDLGGEG